MLSLMIDTLVALKLLILFYQLEFVDLRVVILFKKVSNHYYSYLIFESRVKEYRIETYVPVFIADENYFRSYF